MNNTMKKSTIKTATTRKSKQKFQVSPETLKKFANRMGGGEVRIYWHGEAKNLKYNRFPSAYANIFDTKTCISFWLDTNGEISIHAPRKSYAAEDKHGKYEVVYEFKARNYKDYRTEIRRIAREYNLKSSNSSVIIDAT